jgi:hypothetical protein
VNLDRTSLQAGLITLVLAWPVHQAVDWALRPTLERVLLGSRPDAQEPDLPPGAQPSTPPVAAAAPVESLASARVEGMLRTADGIPVTDEVVELESRALEVRYTATTDPHGRFVMAEVRPGSDYEVRVETDGRFGNLARRGVGISGGSASLALSFEPFAAAGLNDAEEDDEGYYILYGHVVGDRGEPLAGARLSLSRSHTGAVSSATRTEVTDAAGEFLFMELGSGTHELTASAEGFLDARESHHVSSDTGRVELRLRRSAPVRRRRR